MSYVAKTYPEQVLRTSGAHAVVKLSITESVSRWGSLYWETFHDVLGTRAFWECSSMSKIQNYILQACTQELLPGL